MANRNAFCLAPAMTDRDRPRRQVRDRRNLLTPPAPPKPEEAHKPEDTQKKTDEAVAELIEQIKRQNESN